MLGAWLLSAPPRGHVDGVRQVVGRALTVSDRHVCEALVKRIGTAGDEGRPASKIEHHVGEGTKAADSSIPTRFSTKILQQHRTPGN